jgi:hypothetical protein
MHYSRVDGQLAVQVFDGVCRSHDAGHAPHLVQIRKALKELGEEVLLLPHIDDGTVLISNQGGTIRLYNHHSDVIYSNQQLHPGSQLKYVERFGVLLLPVANDEGFAFSLSKETLRACPR